MGLSLHNTVIFDPETLEIVDEADQLYEDYEAQQFFPMNQSVEAFKTFFNSFRSKENQAFFENLEHELVEFEFKKYKFNWQ